VQALRLLVRASPFLLGALAAAVWLRREMVERPQLMPPKPEPAPAPKPPTGRFERRPVDIVTVVDDLLLSGRP
jgi:hypothetical protein